MFGNNPKRPPSNGTGEILDVQEIFPTLQGEGPYVGWPAIFIRLGGCNLACKFCDTEFESFSSLTIKEILKKISQLNNNNLIKLIVITGGEPLRQPIELLCEELIQAKYKIQIETNGTLYRNLPKEVEIICSPKNNINSYSFIREDLLQRISAFKFIISAHDQKYSNVIEIGQTKFNIPVYIQPMDEQNETKNKKNLELVMALSKEYGYRVSIQMHKIIGIP